MYVCTLFLLHQTDREWNCISWKCHSQSVKTVGMSRTIRGDTPRWSAVWIIVSQAFHKPRNTSDSHTNKWMVLPEMYSTEHWFWAWGDSFPASLHVCVCKPLFAFQHIHNQAGAWETVGPLSRQNHIRTQNDRIDGGRKERKERKQLSIAVGWREKEAERGRREKLNSGRAGVEERVNACVVGLLCPAPEWSVSKLSSNWWFTPPRPYQLKWANNTLSYRIFSIKSCVELSYLGSKVGWSVLEVCGYVQENTCLGQEEKKTKKK